jgi:hypothetical protein
MYRNDAKRIAICRPVALTAAAVLLSACSDRSPQIAQGLSLDFGETGQFDDRVRQRFPIGSSEEALVAELRREEFSIREVREPDGPYRFSATYDIHGFTCRDSWTIEWAVVHERIAMIQGVSRQICL